MEDLGNCIVIIKNVPCMKCPQCGEVSYSGSVVRRIEQIVDDLKGALTEVAIVNYSKSA
jgi:threonine dehydrogenase-like Zn-dependent dehydrogenase